MARIRSRVLWRKISYGIQTDHGDRAVERPLTSKPAACNADACSYLTDAITAHQHGSQSQRRC
jgi:hypothetical protein